MRPGRVEYTTEGTLGKLVVDGVDLTRIATGITIYHTAREIPHITIDLAPQELILRIGDADIVTWVSSEALNWEGIDSTDEGAT